jgi:hypothetical protein
VACKVKGEAPKSLLVIKLSGLASVIKACWMEKEKGARQTLCVAGDIAVSGVIQKLPMPTFEALVAAIISGVHGTKVWIGMGKVFTVAAK